MARRGHHQPATERRLEVVAPSACFAVLTPSGRGAVATVALTGPGALEVLAHCFRLAKGGAVSATDVGRVRVGRFTGLRGAEEELVVTVLPSAREGEWEIAIHPHGGTAAVAAVTAALEAAGATRLSLEAWAERSEPDLLAAEARLALAEARTERTTRILLDQYRGALRSELLAIRALLSQQEALTAQQALARLEALLRRSQALRLTTPWRVVLTGKPNAGKSSLLNALVGYRRAITHDVPGTTRDVVIAETAFDGWPVELRDTAGLRAPGDELEAAGVARAREEIAAADLVLLLIDCREDHARETASFLAEFPASTSRLLVVRTQADRLPCMLTEGPLLTSATSQLGLDALQAQIVQRLILESPLSGGAVAFSTRQMEILQQAVERCRRGDFPSGIQALNQFLGINAAEIKPEPPENGLRGPQQSLE